jgi:hypothetical protein
MTNRIMVDGVPVLVADAPGPFTASLLFRVGVADEDLLTHGITHLVEHLALFRVEPVPFDVDGYVELSHTGFAARGRPEQVASFLRAVCLALHDLPLDRLEAERRVLATEDHEPGLGDELLSLTCGPVGFGLAGEPEHGLRLVDAAAVAAWARERFTAGNAVAWLSGPPPPGLSLPLPPGPRHPVPAVAPIPALRFPAWAEGPSGVVALGALAPLSTPLRAATAVAERRADGRVRRELGVSYEVAASVEGLDERVAQLVLSADCQDHHAPRVRDELLGVLDALAAEGPSPGELAEEVDRWRASAEDPEHALAEVDLAALDELLGRPHVPFAARLDELARCAPRDVAAALAGALERLVVLVPEGSGGPARAVMEVGEYEDAAAPVEGRAFRPRRAGVLRRRPAGGLVVGRDALAFLSGDEAVTVPLADVVALWRDADGVLELQGRDGRSVSFDPGELEDGDEARRLVEAAVPAGRIVPTAAAEAEAALRSLAGAELGRLARSLRAELAELPRELEEGERVERLARARRGMKEGLLALTDRRVLWAMVSFEAGDAVRLPRAGALPVEARGSRLVLAQGTPRELAWEVAPGGRAEAIAAALRRDQPA